MEKKRFTAKILIFVGAVIVLLILVGVYAKSNTKAVSSDAQQVSIASPKEVKQINKQFEFPIKDSSGAVATNFQYIIQSAQLQNQIVVKGQKATAISGRTFLIINLKLANSSDKNIQINSRDYIRLGINGEKKDLLAPDIHNDPITIQPISTEYTHLGFPVNATDKNFTLYVGEIEGSKSAIEVKF